MRPSAAPLARALLPALCVLAILGARPSLAQAPSPPTHGMSGRSALPPAHGMAPAAPSLQQRVADADAAALATLEAVEGGRLRFAAATPVLGSVPERFEVKQRPSAPLSLAVGDRALLLLRGARSPYLALDAGEDTVRIADEAGGARWSEAVRAVASAGDDPAALRALYVSWTESEDDGLRREALRALLQPGGPFLPMPPAPALERARVAFDPLRSLPARSAAVALAATDADALDWMLGQVAAEPETADPEVLETILRAGLSRGRGGSGRALAAALGAAEAAQRLAALRVVALAPRADVETKLAKLAARDPDPRVREQAAHRLARAQRETPERRAD
jgi:hypothetical protein